MIGMVLFTGLFVGMICSIAPSAIAKKRNREDLAYVSLGICCLCGLLGGLLLAVPAALIMIAVVLNATEGEKK